MNGMKKNIVIFQQYSYLIAHKTIEVIMFSIRTHSDRDRITNTMIAGQNSYQLLLD